MGVPIIQGEDKILIVDLINGTTNEPFDLTGATEILCHFGGANPPLCVDETLSGGNVTIISPLLGKIQISLPAADTDNLATGTDLGFEVQITINGKVSIAQLLASIDVIAQLFVCM
jgi:hypothetical protein